MPFCSERCSRQLAGLGVWILLMTSGAAWAEKRLEPQSLELTRRTLSSEEKRGLYLQLIENFAGWAESGGFFLETDVLESGGGYFEAAGRGVTWARGNSNMCLAYALLLTEYPERKSFTIHNIPRERMEDHLRRTIRSVCLANKNLDRHKTGGPVWGGPAWQTALEFIGTAWAAHLWQAGLDQDTLEMVREVASKEARLLDKPIPSRRYGDTGAEDCCWNAAYLAFAANKYSDHPEAEHWDHLARKWALNGVSIGPDAESGALVDGIPLKEWIVSENLHPDLTLENHGFWSVGYQVSSQHFGEAAVAYSAFGRSVPEALSHHAKEMWENVTRALFLWDGDLLFPHGQDWAWKIYSYNEYLAWQATCQQNLEASAYESRAVQMILKRQLSLGTGELGAFDFGNQTTKPKRWAFSYLMHKAFPAGTVPFQQAERNSHAVHVFSHNKAAIHRTADKCVSVSWHPWSQAVHVLPEGDSTFEDPPFFIPYDRSCGVPEVKVLSAAQVEEQVAGQPELVSLTESDGRMEVTLKRPAVPGVTQYVRVVSWADNVTLYCTAFRASEDMEVEVGPLFPVRFDFPPGFEAEIGINRGARWVNAADHLAFVSARGIPPLPGPRQFALTEPGTHEVRAGEWFGDAALAIYARQQTSATADAAENFKITHPLEDGCMMVQIQTADGTTEEVVVFR